MGEIEEINGCQKVHLNEEPPPAALDDAMDACFEDDADAAIVSETVAGKYN